MGGDGHFRACKSSPEQMLFLEGKLAVLGAGKTWRQGEKVDKLAWAEWSILIQENLRGQVLIFKMVALGLCY